MCDPQGYGDDGDALVEGTAPTRPQGAQVGGQGGGAEETRAADAAVFNQGISTFDVEACYSISWIKSLPYFLLFYSSLLT